MDLSNPELQDGDTGDSDTRIFGISQFLHPIFFIKVAGIKLQGDQGEIFSLQDQTSPCFELKEKLKCIEYRGKDEKWAETSP